MVEKAVIDRFEGGLAVLLVGEDERRIDIPRECLPKGAREGYWLQVELEEGQLVYAALDPEETMRAKRRILEKLQRLRRGDHLK